MNELFIYSCIMLAGVLISAFSQIMLKKSSMKQYDSRIAEYLNPLVITAYGMFFGCTLISMYALKVVPLSMAPILESSSYIITPVLSRIFLKEKMNTKQFMGMMLIVIGIAIFVS